MPSSSIQILFEEAESDCLLFHDACFSADTAMTLGSTEGSVTELIAACGFETTTPGVGHNSFSYALIRELSSAAEKSISVSELYNRILSRLRNTPDRQQNATPIHCTLTSDGDRRSIMLKPLPLPWISSASEDLEESDQDGTLIYNLGFLVPNGMHSTELYQWLMKAPSIAIDVYFHSIMSGNSL
jgi:hypothetical protein